ncbi:MAG TPA: hypothetical protein VMA13_02315, partial [Candidatus Saccharimonadales bacterium]|nr:hypothetical protein [Candidatus Saccharimonadales bacterium]
PTPPEYLPQSETERQALVREADFAFKQAFAFCPYSPEVVQRYVSLLLMQRRVDDAILVAQTCSDFDPYNGPMANMLKELEKIKKQYAGQAQFETELQQMENEARTNPTNFQNIFNLASIYLQMQQTDRVIELFDRALANPHISPDEIGAIAQFYIHIGNMPKLENALERLATVIPNEPEPWYDLAALKVLQGKTSESLQDLRLSLDLSAKRLKQNPKARDLLAEVRKDHRFDSVRNLTEFQKLVPPK